MKLSQAIKPVSYFKANMAEILNKLRTGESGPMIITQNGEASAVLQSVQDYERTQETLALLKILAMSQRCVEKGQVRPAGEAFADIRNRLGIQ
jgi:prevent-host-death family protein